MRTLSDIIEAAKIGEPTTHEECLYALLAYSGLAYFDSSALRHLAFEPSKFRTPEHQAEESFQRWKMALAKSPKDWLGPSNDPANEECRERVRLARRLFDKVTSQTKP
ncbi:MAG: hypothetical protein ACREJC_23150 [Tepidisphaeraceae bacterium]